MRAYDDIVPGAAERIIAAMERSTYGREDRLDRVVTAAVVVAKRGQWFAMSLAGILVLAGIAFLVRNQVAAGAVCIGIPTVLLVKAFLPTSGRPRDGDDESGENAPVGPLS